MGTDEFPEINKDPNAPIFKIADYGIIGDLNNVMVNMVKKGTIHTFLSRSEPFRF